MSYVPATDQLAGIEVPCAVVAGADNRDPASPGHWFWEASQWFADGLGVPVVVAPGAHVPQASHPRELVATVRRSPTDERRTVTTRYVVGADGANSLVRQWIGSTVTDLGYFHDWLVIDLLMHAPLEDFDFSPPAWQLCDPARPTTLVPGGPGRRRFEFMRLPTETVDELNEAETAWNLLAPWGITPATAKLERHTVYTFQARWCDTWRKGRLLLAGDSAHLMPPFAGQGMCSGLRDAFALAWRLDLVLDGRARRHHPRQLRRRARRARPALHRGLHGTRGGHLPTRPGRRRLERRDDEGGPRRRRPATAPAPAAPRLRPAP